jgi:hypothetical protein
LNVKRAHWAAAVMVAVVLPTIALASVNFKTLPCAIINQVYNAVFAVGPVIVVIMFLYGGVKYTSSADNPGGRNQGKTICIHAMIGGIIWSLWATIGPGLLKWSSCWGAKV